MNTPMATIKARYQATHDGRSLCSDDDDGDVAAATLLSAISIWLLWDSSESQVYLDCLISNLICWAHESGRRSVRKEIPDPQKI